MTIPANIQLARSDSKANGTLRSALRYAERSWPIFPLWPRYGDDCACGDADCKSQGKHPIGHLVPNGFKDATTDQETISRWWREYPDAGIGMPTGSKSGMVVIDIDVKGGKDGTVALENLRHLPALPETTAALTPSGGPSPLLPGPWQRSQQYRQACRWGRRARRRWLRRPAAVA